MRNRSLTWALLLVATAALLVGPSLAAGERPQRAAQTPGGSDWSANAAQFRGQNGARYVYTCPSYGRPGNVWGTDVYTDDSSVCTAAVHAGKITLAGGGTVTIEIRPGEKSYTGSTRNGITSSDYGSWPGSYVIVAASPNAAGVGVGGSTWDASALSFRLYVGARFAYTCPAGGSEHAIWGTDVYTDDSSVCTAGVHAGLVTFARGGRVTIEIRPGQSAYKGSTRHGVTSRDYGPWGGSFVVLGGAQQPPAATATGTVTVNGQPFTSGEIPYGSTVDVSKGTVNLMTDIGALTAYGAAGTPASFKLVRASKTVVELRLVGGDFGACSGRALAKRKKKRVRLVWASGKGRYRTAGRDSIASVHGTTWRTEDRCDGTLTYVARGVVTVRDLRRHRTVTVRAGHSYLALHRPGA